MSELQHFGIKGQRWGVRRYQNEDGTLTEAGKKHYGEGGERSRRGRQRDLNKLDDEKVNSKFYNVKFSEKAEKRETKLLKKGKDISSDKKIQKYREKAEKYKSLSDRDQNLTNKIIEDSLSKNMSIETKDIKRTVEKGKSATIGILSTVGMVASASLVGVGVGITPIKTVPGTKYKVKEDGKGEIRENNKSTPMSVVSKQKDVENSSKSSTKDENKLKSFESKEAIENIDYSNKEQVNNKVKKSLEKFENYDVHDRMYKKYGIDQNSAQDFAKMPKFNKMINKINEQMEAYRNDFTQASKKAGNKLRGPAYENRQKKMVKYWDELSKNADSYINKNFSGPEKDLARTLIYYQYIDW